MVIPGVAERPGQLTDLFPRDVVRLVVEETQAFGDEKRRSETIGLQQWSHIRIVRPVAVIEGKDNHPVRTSLDYS